MFGMKEIIKDYFRVPNDDKDVIIRFEPEVVKFDLKRIFLLSIAYTAFLLASRILSMIAKIPTNRYEWFFSIALAIWCVSFCFVISNWYKAPWGINANKACIRIFWSGFCALGTGLSISSIDYRHSLIYFVLHIAILAFVPLGTTRIILSLLLISFIAQSAAIFKTTLPQSIELLIGCFFLTTFVIFLRKLNLYLYKNQIFFSCNERRFETVLKDLYEKAFEVDLNRDKYILLKDDMFRFKSDKKVDKYSTVVGNLAENLIHPEDKDLFLNKVCPDNLRRLFADNEDNMLNIEYRKIANNGEYRWVSLTFLRARNTGNDIILFGLVKDIHKSKIREERLIREAQIDHLTKLYNKITTERLINDFLQNDRSGGNHAFIMIDIDNFKSINDTYGHFYGDGILTIISEILRKNFRLSDIIGRIGGDELVVFMKNVHSIEYVYEKVNLLCGNFRKEMEVNGKPIKITSSIGVAICDIDGKTYDELYRNADAALYEAKRLGKNRFMFYSDLGVKKYMNRKWIM